MSERERIRALLADEDRAKIVRKASEDVDEFIANLPKKKYEDGWAEENWEQVYRKVSIIHIDNYMKNLKIKIFF